MNNCIICFEDFIYKDKLVKCDICPSYIHKSCYKKWAEKLNYVKCIHCNQDNTLYYGKYSLYRVIRNKLSKKLYKN